jgi:hypothetical protein
LLIAGLALVAMRSVIVEFKISKIEVARGDFSSEAVSESVTARPSPDNSVIDYFQSLK